MKPDLYKLSTSPELAPNADLKIIKGFTEWLVIAADVIRPFYTTEVAEVYVEFEDFAVEVFFDCKIEAEGLPIFP